MDNLMSLVQMEVLVVKKFGGSENAVYKAWQERSNSTEKKV